MIYAPFIFWFWDEPLDPAKMAEMSRTMASQRFSPGYAHARKSMVGTPDLPDAEWLGDRWFAAFGAALKEAEARKNYLGYCDEYWWPSFQANGRVLAANPELRAVSLNWETIPVAGGSETQVPASFFAVAAELDQAASQVGGQKSEPPAIRSRTLQVIGAGEPFAWKAPAGGTWRVYVFNTYSHAGADGSNVNYLDSRLAPKFIEIALEPYARRLGDRLGRSIPGDFIDNEGDYGWGLAWSATLDERYRDRYGRDIRLWLPLSVDRDVEGAFARARWDAGLKPLFEAGVEPPGLESPIRFSAGAFPMLQHRRRIDGREFFWLANNTEAWQMGEVLVRGVKGAASIWDCETGVIRPVASADTSDGSSLALVFKPFEAYWLVFDPKKEARTGSPEREPEIEVVATIDGPWKVTYDPALQPVMEFPATPSAEFAQGVEKPLEDWSAWGLQKFSGLLDYAAMFSLENPGKEIHLDLGKVGHAAEVWVNGKSCGTRLWGPHVFEIGDALRPGQNEVRVRVANLINNSYGEYAESGLLGPVRIVQLR